MLVKCRNRVLNSNLLNQQILPFVAKQNVRSRLLSTSKLSANQYDDLYADRWAKFQCEFLYSSTYCNFEVKIDFSLSLSEFFLRISPLREFHTTCTQLCKELNENLNRSSVQFVHKTISVYNCNFFFILFAAKKLPKNVNMQGVFAANELDLNEVSVYGFDYDYT